MRERGILFALLAGMGAMTYHSTSSPGVSSHLQTNAASEQAGPSELELAKTFERFDKRRKFLISTDSDGATLTTEPLNESKTQSGSLRFDWVLAIIPDPEHSNLKLDFDRDLEAIQLAAAKGGYQFERYWLPWQSEAASEKEKPYILRPELINPKEMTGESKGFRVFQERESRSALPGVLLFRNGNAAPLAVFLVSEHPTAGIAPEEFRNAVRFGKALSRLAGTADDDHLRIIGPGFSGSLATLSTLINVQSPPFTEIFVRTWTQDHASHEDFRKSVYDANEALENNRERQQIDGRHFQPVEVDSIPATDRFVAYISQEWHDTSPILLLTEETTAFGGGVRNHLNPEDPKNPRAPKAKHTDSSRAPMSKCARLMSRPTPVARRRVTSLTPHSRPT